MVTAAFVACSDDGLEPGDRPGADLRAELARHGFTGQMESQVPVRLGRAIDARLVELGRFLFFDRMLGLHSDADGANGNSCAGCHAPAVGFGDTQPIAIGVDNNGVVGPARRGPRNQRRSPLLTNIAFVPRLMWDGRFFAPSGDPFDNSLGFTFPDPEGTTKFAPNDVAITHLLVAQAHIPPTELPEMTGFTGTAGTNALSFVERMRLPAARRRADAVFGSGAPSASSSTDAFDDGHGRAVPPPNEDGYRNDAVREAVLEGLNANVIYRQLFGRIFPDVAGGAPIDFVMVSQAIAEFQISLTFMDAPVDRFARGDDGALTESELRGGVLFFGRAGCVGCHAVAGESNEMFSDFRNYRIGVPPIAPQFGVGTGNVEFVDGMEDLGAEHSTGAASDRYSFRTTPLRNIAVQPHFFHNGSFDRIEDAIRHHLDVFASARGYDPAAHGVPADLRVVRPSVEPVLANVHERLRTPISLTDEEFEDLVAFVRDALLDDRALPANLCREIPAFVPSGMTLMTFQGC
jgi:cytochrome c peroxidase